MTLLTIFTYILWTVEVFAVLAIIAIGADMTLGRIQAFREGMHRGRHRSEEVLKTTQEERRAEKERLAYEGFFEESYVEGTDYYGNTVWYKVLIPTETALEFYRAMDQLSDEQIFQNTEEL